jgi:hypothetical protein
MTAAKRRSSSLSRGNVGKEISDEELAISPRMVAYTVSIQKMMRV